jgi:ribosomal protein S18 acetylase RimI-like enzyme
VSAFVKNDSNEIFAGILGEINWDWMHIQGLWVDTSVRKMGWGLKLLSEMEGYALSKGIKNVRLETTTFQALDFYIKAGYSIFGELANMPNGHTSYFLQKQLNV